jgi:hypothetical protein
MSLASICLVAAAAFGVAGTALGTAMGMLGDFTLAHAHAHVNLLGWVTLALYGLYYRGSSRQGDRLAGLQVGCALVGTTLMTTTLTAYLASGTETKPFIVVAMLSSLLVVAGAVLFLVVVVRDVRLGRIAPSVTLTTAPLS